MSSIDPEATIVQAGFELTADLLRVPSVIIDDSRVLTEARKKSGDAVVSYVDLAMRAVDSELYRFFEKPKTQEQASKAYVEVAHHPTSKSDRIVRKIRTRRIGVFHPDGVDRSGIETAVKREAWRQVIRARSTWTGKKEMEPFVGATDRWLIGVLLKDQEVGKRRNMPEDIYSKLTDGEIYMLTMAHNLEPTTRIPAFNGNGRGVAYTIFTNFYIQGLEYQEGIRTLIASDTGIDDDSDPGHEKRAVRELLYAKQTKREVDAQQGKGFRPGPLDELFPSSPASCES